MTRNRKHRPAQTADDILPPGCVFASYVQDKLAMPPKRKAPPSRLGSWYTKITNFWLADFDVARLFSKRHEPGPPRTVFVNEPLPEEYYDHKRKVHKDKVFITNQVITSKYTVVTFLPRNLLEQFRRVANM